MKNLFFIIITLTIQYVLFKEIFISKYLEYNFFIFEDLLNSLFAIYVLFAVKNGLYSRSRLPLWGMLRKHFILSVEYIGIVMIILYLNEDIRNNGVFLANLFSNLTLSVSFLLFNFFFYTVFRGFFKKMFSEKILIIGTGIVAKNLVQGIKRNKFLNCEIAGFLSPGKFLINEDTEVAIDKVNILGEYKNLYKILEEHRIKEVIIALPEISAENFKLLIHSIGNRVDRVTFIPKLNGGYTFSATAHDYDGVLAITSKTGILKNKMLILKRIIDIVASLFGIFLFGFIYLIVARKIKSDGGNALYAQERIGKDLKPFKIYKFRSMYSDADKRLEELLKDEKIKEEYYRTFKLKDDPRITKVGAFLRKTSLDEFPQFINVLKGDMSLIGPRPIVKKELEDYYMDLNGSKVFAYKPGITGMWQSHGRSTVEDYEERIELDLYYTRNWCLWLDFMILVKTFINIVKKDDAY